MTTKKTELPKTINCPEDTTLFNRLRYKYQEYQKRMGEYAHPEKQLLDNPDAFFKAYILKKILDEGKAEFDDIALELNKLYPNALKGKSLDYLNAWAVIWDYCETAGKHTLNTRTGKRGLAR